MGALPLLFPLLPSGANSFPEQRLIFEPTFKFSSLLRRHSLGETLRKAIDVRVNHVGIQLQKVQIGQLIGHPRDRAPIT